MSPDDYLVSHNILLPPAQKPSGNYVPCRAVGNIIYVSGHGPRSIKGEWICGRVDPQTNIDEAYQAARYAGLNMLATLQQELGALSKIEKFVKVMGMVNATSEFSMHPKVIDGFSDLMREVFGDAGLHSRSAVGMGSLPHGIIVEVEAILILKT